MKRSMSVRVALGAVVVATGAMTALPASAATTGYAYLECTGHIYGGLTPTGPAFRNVDMACVGVTATTNTSTEGPINCNFAGNDLISSFAQSQGVLNGLCNTLAGVGQVDLNYQRLGAEVVLAGNAVGPINGAVTGGCAWVPVPGSAVPPVVDGFAADCHLVFS